MKRQSLSRSIEPRDRSRVPALGFSRDVGENAGVADREIATSCSAAGHPIGQELRRAGNGETAQIERRREERCVTHVDELAGALGGFQVNARKPTLLDGPDLAGVE